MLYELVCGLRRLPKYGPRRSRRNCYLWLYEHTKKNSSCSRRLEFIFGPSNRALQIERGCRSRRRFRSGALSPSSLVINGPRRFHPQLRLDQRHLDSGSWSHYMPQPRTQYSVQQILGQLFQALQPVSTAKFCDCKQQGHSLAGA